MNKTILFLSFIVVAGSAQASSLNTVAKRLARGVPKTPAQHIAVLPFMYPGGAMSSGSSIISERLTTLLVDLQIHVVERALLNKVLGEMKLEMSGVTDAAATQKLGKTLGVEEIVIGSLNDLHDQETELNVRLVRTETGEVLAAASTIVDRTWRDAPAVPAPPPPQENTGVIKSELIPVQMGPHAWLRPSPPPPPRKPARNSFDYFSW